MFPRGCGFSLAFWNRVVFTGKLVHAFFHKVGPLLWNRSDVFSKLTAFRPRPIICPLKLRLVSKHGTFKWEMGKGGGVFALHTSGAAHPPSWRRQKSRRALPLVCVVSFPFSPLSLLLTTQKHHSCPCWITLVDLSAAPPPPAPSHRLLYFFVKFLNCPFIPDSCHPPLWRDLTVHVP